MYTIMQFKLLGKYHTYVKPAFSFGKANGLKLKAAERFSAAFKVIY